MKISLTSVHVDDQQKALRFYTEVLGFVKKADIGKGSYRWLTVASPDDPDGTQLPRGSTDSSRGSGRKSDRAPRTGSLTEGVVHSFAPRAWRS
jgi:catechol 2,3-dioxygenase-like lactoylglutathione lyase family enzyme